MAELPFHLKTLEPLPGALDILRFFGDHDEETADVDEICDALGLSDRRFSKAMRRLVTKGYVQMDGDQVYRLTDQGDSAVDELSEYDAEAGGGDESSESDTPPKGEWVSRRMIMVTPQNLVANQPVNIVVGFHQAAATSLMPGMADIVVRVSSENGEPQTPEDAVFSLSNGTAQQAIQVTPAAYNQMRLKFQVFQVGAINPEDIDEAGGMYVDIPVVASGRTDQMTAYGTDIRINI